MMEGGDMKKFWMTLSIVAKDDEFDGITHITNTGGMGINIDEANEQVKYTIFTIAPFAI